MRRSVTVVTKPAAEPVILNEVKEFARVDGTDEDALLADLITVAWQSVEQHLRRAVISQTLKLTIDLSGKGWYDALPEGVYDMAVSALYGGLPRIIELPRAPIQSVTSVVTYDTSNNSSTFASGNYLVDTAGGRIVLSDTASWPSNMRRIAACEITYVAGYGDASTDVPQPIKTAIKMQAAYLYESRGMCDANAMTPAAEHLLRPYRIMDGLANG